MVCNCNPKCISGVVLGDMFGNKRKKLEEALAAEKPIALLFTGRTPPSRCGPGFIDSMPPMFNSVTKGYSDHVFTTAIDVFKEPAIAYDFGVRTIPTIVYMRGRRELHRFEGPIPERTLRWYLDRVAAPAIAPDSEEDGEEPAALPRAAA